MAQISLIALSLILLTLASIVWRARPESPANRWFVGYTVLMAAWIFGIAGLHGGTNLEFWGRFTFASASLMPAAFLGFTRCYPTAASDWLTSIVLRATLAIGSIFGILSLLTPMIVYDVSFTPAGLARKTGLLYPFFAAYFLLGWGSALTFFISKWRHASGLARAQLQYLWAGLIIPVAGGITTNLLLPLFTGRSTYSWVGPYFSLLLVTIVGHAIIRHRLMDLRIVVHRGLAYLLLMTLISTTLILIGRLALPAWDSLATSLPPDLLIVLIVTLLMLSAPGQRFVGRLIDPYLFRGRLDHSSALRDATHRLTRLMQPMELADELHRIIDELFLPESFSMAVQPLEGGAFEELVPSTSGSSDLSTIATLLVDNVHPSALLVNPSAERGSRKAAHESLRSAGVEVICTLGRRGQLFGTMLLGPRRSGDAYYAKDLSFVESLLELASVALENALLYRQRIHMLEYSDRLLESLNSGVIAVDVNGKITSFNPSCLTILGLNGGERGLLLGVLPSEVGWALALAIAGLWDAKDVEISIDHRIRGTLPILLSTAVLRDHNRKVTGALAVVTDLSTVKALERHQRRIEHFALMARFYAGIAHEIRSPLAAISNFVSMLVDRFDDPEYRETAARLLPLEVGRIVRLADRLRLMAPSEDGRLREVSLPPLLSDIIAIHTPAAAESGVKLLLDCPEGLPNIHADPGQLVQLFVNLLRNAVEAMPDGGELLLRCRLGTEDATVVVEIIDEGTGIDPSIRAHLFQPFFTTKSLGTGLGLAICREIADFHRAQLTLLPRSDRSGTIARIQFASGIGETMAANSPIHRSALRNQVERPRI